MLPLWSVSATGNSAAKTDSLTAQQVAAIRFVAHKTQRYAANDCHWRQLAGRRCIRSSGSYTRTRSLAYAQWSLKLWTGRSKRDHAHAKRWMVKRIGVLLKRGEQLRLQLGNKAGPVRVLTDAGNIEARYNTAKRTVQQLDTTWKRSGFLAAFTCIHGGEGAWDSNTGNGYYGGLQEDLTFQRQYGPDFMAKWGTADHWPAWAQIAAGVRAVKGWDGPDPRTHAARGFYPWPQTAHNCGLI